MGEIMQKAQGALEYLLLVGGAVIVAGIALVLILGVSQSGTTSTSNTVCAIHFSEVTAIHPNPVTNGLVGWWLLDNSFQANDLGCYNNNGTPQPPGMAIGGVPDHTGKANGATGFDGANNYINLGTTIPSLPSFSVSLWWNGNSPTSWWAGPVQVRLSGKSGFQFVPDTGSLTTFNPHLVIWNGSSEITQFKASTYTINYPFGAWKHYVWTYSGGVARFFVDGVEQTVVASAVAGYAVSGAMIGQGYAKVSGPISDVRVYNRALSPSEVLAIYNSS